jgi:branched-chain amino acid transport system permease protein
MITTIVSGLVVGSIYALIALGYNMTQVAAGVLNFAYPNFIILGAFLAYWLTGLLGLPYLLTILIAAAVAAAIGLLEEIFAIRPVAGHGSHSELVTTVGVATILTGAMLLIWGNDPLTVPSPFSSKVFVVFGGRFQIIDIALIAVALVATGLLTLIVHKTRFGLAALAQAEDRDAAKLRGVSVRRLAIIAFVVATAFAGLIGPLIGIKTFAVATVPLVLAIKGFVAMTLGGQGSFVGGLVGGLVVGLVESLLARYLGADFQVIGLFVIFLVVVIVRPQGIFGTRVGRAV